MRAISASRSHPIWAGLALATLVLALTLVAGCTGPTLSNPNGQIATEAVPSITPPPIYTPGLPKAPAPLSGTPAIKPHLNAVPAFSTQDMADYANSHPLGSGSGQGGLPTITRNEFLPSQTVSGLLDGISTFQPDSTLLGFLEEQGNFTFPAATEGGSLTFPYAFQVFDGQTGNRLIYGGRQQPTPAHPPTPTLQPTVTQGPPPPQISVTPPQTTEFCGNGQWPNKLTVKNTGGGTLSWNISSTLPPNVTATPSNGSLSAGASQSITLGGNTTPPVPQFTITFSSNGGAQDVTITC